MGNSMNKIIDEESQQISMTSHGRQAGSPCIVWMLCLMIIRAPQRGALQLLQVVSFPLVSITYVHSLYPYPWRSDDF